MHDPIEEVPQVLWLPRDQAKAERVHCLPVPSEAAGRVPSLCKYSWWFLFLLCKSNFSILNLIWTLSVGQESRQWWQPAFPHLPDTHPSLLDALHDHIWDRKAQANLTDLRGVQATHIQRLQIRLRWVWRLWKRKQQQRRSDGWWRHTQLLKNDGRMQRPSEAVRRWSARKRVKVRSNSLGSLPSTEWNRWLTRVLPTLHQANPLHLHHRMLLRNR